MPTSWVGKEVEIDVEAVELKDDIAVAVELAALVVELANEVLFPEAVGLPEPLELNVIGAVGFRGIMVGVVVVPFGKGAIGAVGFRVVMVGAVVLFR